MDANPQYCGRSALAESARQTFPGWQEGDARAAYRASVAMLIAFVAPRAVAAEAASARRRRASIAPAVAGDGTVARDPLLRWPRGRRQTGEPSLREMIGQMILVGFPGTRPQEEWPARIIAMIHEGRIGGVILFAPTSSRRPRCGRSTSPSAAPAAACAPFICIDQEGGAIQRLTRAKGFVGLPGAAQMARMSLDKAYELDVRSARGTCRSRLQRQFRPGRRSQRQPRQSRDRPARPELRSRPGSGDRLCAAIHRRP